MYKVYDIKNCDTIKKAMTWLKEHHISVEFHDYAKEGISQQKVEQWLQQYDWEQLINKKGTTWRQLPENEKATTKEEAINLMMKRTSVIKRPIIESDKIVVVGFQESTYEQLFKLNE